MAALTSFRALADPGRLAIVELLREGDRPVGELVDEMGMHQPAVSKQLRVLRDAGLVAASVRGRQRLYRLEPAPLREVERWLAPFQELWEGRLDRLEAHLERTREDRW